MKKYQLSHLISLQNSIHFYTTLRLRRGQDVSQLILLCRSLKHLMLLFITVIRIIFFLNRTFCFKVLLPIASCTSPALKNIHSSLWNAGLSYFGSCGWPWLGASLLLKQPLSELSLYRNHMNTLDHIFKITCYILLSSIVSHHTYRSV